MLLTEQHIIKSNDWRYEPLIQLLQLSNNIANTAHYVIRQHYFHVTGQNYTEDIASDAKFKYVNYLSMDRILKDTKNKCYRNLPANTAQEVLKAVDRQWHSFFELMQLFKEGKLENRPSIPHYRKKGGTFLVVYNAMTFKSQKSFNRDGSFKLPKCKIPLQIINFKTCKQVRIILKTNYIVIENIYESEVKEIKADNKRYLSIDLGINNLATCVSNVSRSFIIDGKYIKSVNQFYNKEVARLKSILENSKQGKTSRRIQRLGEKRHFIIKDYFHKASRFIINYCVENDINTIVIGKNKQWKNECNIGSVNNQNFVQIPHNLLVSMLTYKAQLVGINVVEQEESYTSKCSFFDNDYIPTYGVDDDKLQSTGRRVKRGCYKTSTGFKFNADVNGSLNILRKCLNVLVDREVSSEEIISQASRGLVVNPVRLRFDK